MYGARREYNVAHAAKHAPGPARLYLVERRPGPRHGARHLVADWVGWFTSTQVLVAGMDME